MQYIVSEHDKKKREELYDYICNNYHLEVCYPFSKDAFINSKYPFVIDFKEHILWICESITCLACAAQNDLIISTSEFRKMI